MLVTDTPVSDIIRLIPDNIFVNCISKWLRPTDLAKFAKCNKWTAGVVRASIIAHIGRRNYEILALGQGATIIDVRDFWVGIRGRAFYYPAIIGILISYYMSPSVPGPAVDIPDVVAHWIDIGLASCVRFIDWGSAAFLAIDYGPGRIYEPAEFTAMTGPADDQPKMFRTALSCLKNREYVEQALGRLDHDHFNAIYPAIETLSDKQRYEKVMKKIGRSDCDFVYRQLQKLEYLCSYRPVIPIYGSYNRFGFQRYRPAELITFDDKKHLSQFDSESTMSAGVNEYFARMFPQRSMLCPGETRPMPYHNIAIDAPPLLISPSRRLLVPVSAGYIPIRKSLNVGAAAVIAHNNCIGVSRWGPEVTPQQWEVFHTAIHNSIMSRSGRMRDIVQRYMPFDDEDAPGYDCDCEECDICDMMEDMGPLDNNKYCLSDSDDSMEE